MNNTKPLFRWSIGDISKKESFDVLKQSIRFLKKIYGKSFDYIICYNIIDQEKINILKNISKVYDVALHKQKWKESPIPDYIPIYKKEKYIDSSKTSGSLWKYCPNRLRKYSYEILIDNDLVIFEKIKPIDEFLNSKCVLLSKDNLRFFGRYDFLHPENVAFNSGIIGLPPLFDFHSEIQQIWNKYKLYNLSYSDEQGLITYVLTNVNHILVDTHEIGIFHHDLYFDGKNKINYSQISLNKFKGLHFVGINRRQNHNGWNYYNQLKLL